MKERPIVFSGESVRAILEGRKTQTRRVVKQKRGWDSRHPVCDPMGAADDWAVWFHCPDTDRVGHIAYCPYGQPGDRLWVRESAYIAKPNFGDPCDANRVDDEGRPRVVGYAASMDSDSVRCAKDYGVKLSPSIYLPHWASRITLEIVKVRVERVQAISMEDCEAEGYTSWVYSHPDTDITDWMVWYSELWDSINAKRGFSWDTNPWVWVIEFGRVGA